MAQLNVERTIWIKAPRERVWRAITDDKEIMQWWGDHWEIPLLQVGATIKFGDPGDLMHATIDVLDPPRQFTILWPPQPQYHNIKIYTIFQLEEENGGTRLTVTETGFEALPDDIRQTRIDQTSAGYSTVLADLKAMIEHKDA
jgi:uncharacterized protein YndB with AHSA1/START domain